MVLLGPAKFLVTIVLQRLLQQGLVDADGAAVGAVNGVDSCLHVFNWRRSKRPQLGHDLAHILYELIFGLLLLPADR